MRVFTYTASYRKDSNTERIIDLIINLIREKESVIEYRHSAKCDHIHECIGCENCFKNGLCVLDKTDAMGKIKSELFDSDVILLGSPVYAAMVSGNMKKLIDRLSYYLHTFFFRGKLIIPILSASGNSLLDTNAYIKKIAESWGGIVPFSILFTVDAPNMLEMPAFMQDVLPGYADEIIEYVVNGKKKRASEYQEKYYLQLKRFYSLPGDDAERMYWRESGLLDYTSFQEVLDVD